MANMSASLTARLRALFDSRGRFFRDVATMLSGTLASRVIAVLSIPLLSRLYSPAEFGLLALFSMVCALLTSVACGRYEMALVLPDSEHEALHLLIASLAIAAIFSLGLVAGMWIFSADLAALLSAPELSQWLWLAPPMVFAISAFNALRSWAARGGRFKAVSTSTVMNSLVTAIVQILMVFPRRLAEGGLIYGRIAGQSAQTLLLLMMTRKDMRRARGGGLSWATTRRLLVRYRDFPLLDTGANFLNASSRQLPVLLLGVFFSPVIVGFYSVGRRMLGIPVQLVTNAIAQVFFPKAVLENNDGDLAVFAGSVLRRLAIAGIAPMVMGMVIMQDIVRIFLGATWLDSVIYVQWLTLYVAMIFVTAPFSQLFSVLERQRERLVYISVLGALQAAVLVYGGQQQDPVLAVALFSIISAVGTLLNYLWLLSCAGVSVGFSMRVLAKELIWTGVFAGALVLVKSQQLSSPIVLAISAGLLSLYFRLRYRQLMGGKTPRVGNV